MIFTLFISCSTKSWTFINIEVSDSTRHVLQIFLVSGKIKLVNSISTIETMASITISYSNEIKTFSDLFPRQFTTIFQMLSKFIDK